MNLKRIEPYKAPHIIDTLDSVLSQSLNPVEVIVVDDGSTDGGDLVVEELYKGRVTLIRQSNAGVAAARNTGIAYATGDYVAFLDADDLWSVHFLQELDQLARQHPDMAMLATAYQYKVSETDYRQPKIRMGRAARREVLKHKSIKHYFAIAANGDLPFCASSVAIKKQFFNQYGGFPVNESMGEDQCVWSRVAHYSEIAYSPRQLSVYNTAASARACAAHPPLEECEFSRRLLKQALTEANISPAKRASMVRYTAAHMLDLAERNIAVENDVVARALLSDYRCKLKPLKYFKVLGRLWFRFFSGGLIDYLKEERRFLDF